MSCFNLHEIKRRCGRSKFYCSVHCEIRLCSRHEEKVMYTVIICRQLVAENVWCNKYTPGCTKLHTDDSILSATPSPSSCKARRRIGSMYLIVQVNDYCYVDSIVTFIFRTTTLHARVTISNCQLQHLLAPTRGCVSLLFCTVIKPHCSCVHTF